MADEYVIEMDVHVDPLRTFDDPRDTIAGVEKILVDAGRPLRRLDYPDDAYCPVRFEHANVREMSDSPNPPTNSDASPGYNLFANAPLYEGQPVAGVTWGNKVLVRLLENWKPSASTHEFGHLVGLWHTDRCTENSFINGFATCVDPPPGRSGFLFPYQCTRFLNYAGTNGRKARCVLYDAALAGSSGIPDPAAFMNTPQWSTCYDNPGDAPGYCDGAGGCVEVVPACFDFDSHVPRPPGSDCGGDDVCRVCAADGTSCVPCDAPIEAQTDEYQPAFFYTRPGFTEGTDALYRATPYHPDAAVQTEGRAVIQLGAPVSGLATAPGLPYVYTVEQRAGGNDHLLELDPIARTVADLGALGVSGIVSLAGGAGSSTLLGVAVDEATGASSVHRIDTNDPTSLVTQGTIAGATYVTGIAFDPAAGAERLWGLTDSGATLLQIDPATLQVLLAEPLAPSVTSITYDRIGAHLFGYLEVPASAIGLAWNLTGSGDSPALPFAPGASIATAAVCGDGHTDVEAGEKCDDGNLFDHDTCTRYCQRYDPNDPDVIVALGDADGDGLPFYQDNCPETVNALQDDSDGDGVGDACDGCPDLPNPTQEDTDADGVGDGCDNAPTSPNPDQLDSDGDGVGDAGDTCPDLNTFNPTVSLMGADQRDSDGDGFGDACDTCPTGHNPEQTLDSDEDGLVDGCDNCVDVGNPDQADLDQDGEGDACDADDDADGVPDVEDNCVRSKNPLSTFPSYRTTTGGQLDDDADGFGNQCDGDFDGDGAVTGVDLLIIFYGGLGNDVAGFDCMNTTTFQADGPCDIFDINGDGEYSKQDVMLVERMKTGVDSALEACDDCPLACEGDECDDDGDGVVNRSDNCSEIANPDQCDTNSDGFGNACDGDFDGDGDVDVGDTRYLLKQFVFSFFRAADPGVDMNCDGRVWRDDFTRHFIPQRKAGAPGPSGLACAGSAPCPEP